MSIGRRVLLLSGLAAALAGCAASGPAFRALEPVAGQSAQVVVYRTDAFLDGGVAWRIDVDGRKVAVLRNAGYAVLTVPAGTATLALRANNLLDAPFFHNLQLALPLEPGTRVFVRAAVGLGTVVVAPAYVGRHRNLAIVPEDVALVELKTLKLSD